jgi:predicted transcriptional regulator of viral defense system
VKVPALGALWRMRLGSGNGGVIFSGWPDHQVGELAGRQRTLITRHQLLALGVSSSAIARAVARGRLHRVHNGVYSLVGLRARPPWAAEQAALLAYGRAASTPASASTPTSTSTSTSAVLSHHSAARLHGLGVPGPPVAPPHVTLIGSHRKPSHRGVVVYRTATLPRQEHHRLNGLPVTSVARTTLDLMSDPGLTPRGREVLVDEALRKTSRGKLTEIIERHRGRPGAPALAVLLDPARPSSISWSKTEERLREMFHIAELPAPESNVRLPGRRRGRYFPDLLWRAEKVIVEYDSAEYHAGPGAFTSDRTRHNDLTADGYQVLHMTADQPLERVLVWVAQALARSRAG